jgi:hypothetical protein
MPFTRPNGVSCSGYVYPDKKNTYEKLKEFLFDNASGRTDVVYLCSAASGFEPTQNTHTTDPDSYHYTGGLIDGFSKAILQGSLTRTPRPMYATGVQFAYTCNKIPDFDRWNSATWFTPNTTGVGGYLTGCSTVYNNYFYYKLNSAPVGTSGNSNTGFFPISAHPSQTYPYFDEFDTGTLINVDGNALWANAVQDPNDIAIASSTKAKKQLTLLRNGLIGFPSSTRDGALDPSVPFNSNFTVTPEQPQRYWDRENSWYITRTHAFPIGLAYIDTATNTISEIFADANTYGYVPVGLTVGQTVTAAKALLAAGKLDVVQYIDGAFRGEIDPLLDQFQIMPQPGVNNTPIAYSTALNSRFGNKKILFRYVTVDEIITIRSLNIAANNSAITNYAAWKAVDGFRVGDVVVFRSSWANPLTIPPTSGEETFLTSSVDKKFGLATSTDAGVSTWQQGLPYLFQWGNRPTFLSTNAWDLIDWSISRANNLTGSPSSTAQIAGFPRSLSTIAPCGFFRLSNLDSTPLFDPSYTKYRERGIIIKPNLGKFFSSITTDGSLQKTAVSAPLLNKDKASLNIFKSANFKYCVNSYTIDRYAGDGVSATSLLRLTAYSKTSSASPYTLISASNITLTNPLVPNTQRRTVQRKNNILSVDLSTVNASWGLHEIHLGFLGRDGIGTTNGDMLLTTHYGIDTANQHGIAFSKLDTTFAYRSGDAAYQNDSGYSSGGRSSLYVEYFKSIYERQTNTATFNAIPGITPKLVIMVETGVWELANANFSYNGFNTWGYFIDELPLVGNSSNGSPTYNFGFDALTPIVNAAIIAGFTRNNIVVCFYTPTKLTRVDIASKGTINGVTLDTALEEATYISTKNNRATFIRATEIFVQNNLTYQGGYYTPSPPAPSLVFDGVTNTAAKNSVYINLGSITSLTSILDNITGKEATWYDTTDDILTYRYYSEAGALAIGSFVMDYLAAAVSQTYFVPPWIPPYSRQLKFTTDPVSGADLNLVTVSFDPVDIEPYLVDYDILCDAGNNQAKRTLAKYKTKTLQ